MNPIGWVELPVSDMERAIQFYNKILGWDLKSQPIGVLEMAWFPNDHEANGASGTLIKYEPMYTPSQEGPLVYFSVDDVAVPLSLVEKAGGKVIVEKRQISEEHGYMGVALDTEGNRIAFHSNQ